jgi:hypothetical protein
VPFHSAQFALYGMGDEHIKEASWVVQSVTGASAYLYGVDYSNEKFRCLTGAVLDPGYELRRFFFHAIG